MSQSTVTGRRPLERDFRTGLFSPYLAGRSHHAVAAAASDLGQNSHDAVLAAYRLQDIGDYRQALRSWFAAVRPGGHLLIVVPHAFLYDRQLQLAYRRNPSQRRLYTPASLMDEVQESLEPNAYRVRLLCDDDSGFDYTEVGDEPPSGNSDVLLVLEKIAPPAWSLEVAPAGKSAAPDFAFEPSRSRVEIAGPRSLRRILLLKLDHLGDFVIGLHALERARALFADAHITLVVGSWNLDMARELNLADELIPFDAFPRNSSEEEVNVPGKTALFRAAVVGDFDLAVDLRTDHDTRFLLNHVNATFKAGIGTRAQFPFLDMFLPIDFTRNEPETARDIPYSHSDFHSQGSVVRTKNRLVSTADNVERNSAIIWGPYHHIRPGRYFFEPYIEWDPDSSGMLMLDVGLNAHRVTASIVPGAESLRLPFVVDSYGTEFEFRVWTVEDRPSIDFSFFGGRLVREGASSVLHQSEYLVLLIELIALRIGRTGILEDVGIA